MADPQFRSPTEFREVMDRVFTMMSEDPEVGPRLREADVPQRFEFADVGLVVNVRPAATGEDGNLHWEWRDDVDWTPTVRTTMDSAVCNRYFQGRENLAMAVARRRIRIAGDVRGALGLIPITKPIFERYRAVVADEYPHLTA
jgi:hypothetical protein